MWRYLETLWDSFCPHTPVYPLQLSGSSPDDLIRTAEELAVRLRLYRLFSYRFNFEPISTTTAPVTSDRGWGCLLRTTQMMLSHFLLSYGCEEDRHLRLFLDKSGPDSPFSVHNMIRQTWDRKTFRAEYWSPSQGCEAVSRCVSAAVRDGTLKTRVSVVTSTYGSLYSEDVKCALRSGARVVLILTPVRVSPSRELGQETYLQIEGLLSLPASLGMVGGIPGRSYYFIGHSQMQLLFLDPHQRIQPALVSDSSGKTGVVVPSLEDVRCVHWSRVDTSLYLAFAVRSMKEWAELRALLPTKFLCVEDRHCANDRKLKGEHSQRAKASPLLREQPRFVRTATKRQPQRVDGQPHHATHEPTGSGDDSTPRGDSDSDGASWDMLRDAGR